MPRPSKSPDLLCNINDLLRPLLCPNAPVESQLANKSECPANHVANIIRGQSSYYPRNCLSITLVSHWFHTEVAGQGK